MRRILSLSCLFTMAGAGFADVKVVSQVQMSINGDFRAPEIATTYFKGDWVRIDSKNKSTISNSSKHKGFEIDHLRKTFVDTGGDTAGQAAFLMSMMGAKITAKVTPTGEQKIIAGFKATKFLADFDFDLKLPQAGDRPVHMKIHMENWATTELPIKAEGGSAMGLQNDLLQSLMSVVGIEDVRKELSKIKGFSLANRITTTFDAPDAPAPISIEINYEAVKVSIATINPAMFVVPKEYQEAPSDGDADIRWTPVKKGS